MGVFLGLLAGACLLRSDPPRVQFSLSSGEQIAYVAAGLGKLDHTDSSVAYEWCHRVLAQYGPAVVSKRLPAPRVTSVRDVASRTGAQSLLLLFERQYKPQSVNQKGEFRDLVKLEFEDADGHRLRAQSKFQSFPDGREILSFESFPRRDQKLVIHLTDSADRTKTTSFEIENPGFRTNFPDWSPAGLPQTRSDAAMDVTLRELDADSVAKGKRLPVDVAVRDPAWNRHLVTAWIEDATGNHGDQLSPFETPWKARVSIARTDPAALLPGDKWMLGPFPLSPEGSKIPIEQSREVNGVTFRVRHLETHKSQIPQGVRSPIHPEGSSTPLDSAIRDREFRVEFAESGFHWITFVEDQSGLRLKEVSQPIAKRGKARAMFGVRFTPKPDTTHVSLTLTVSRPKEFEFLIVPPAEIKSASGEQ